jgi:hypothetical protein
VFRETGFSLFERSVSSRAPRSIDRPEGRAGRIAPEAPR